ncbi:FYVE-domain-containing protein, partial [Amniculicola lignicola CBS 123094]
MAFPFHPSQRSSAARSPSVSSTSSSSSDETPVAPANPTHPPRVSSRAARPHSHSTPSLPQLDNDVMHNSPAGHSNLSLDNTNTPRSRGPSAIASHFLAQPNSAYGGQTWIDFLRDMESQAEDAAPLPTPPAFTAADAGLPPRPAASTFTLPARPLRANDAASASSRHAERERKRRLTTPEAPTRRPSGMRTSSNDQGSSSNPIVLDSSPAPEVPTASRPLMQGRPPMPSYPSRSSMAGAASGRRESDLVLPSWQPDSDVTHCRVCGSQFTFFYRKHHCRKCGRVVCSACSPHRITIPRQFIVHPPSESAAGANIIDLTGDDDTNAMSSFGPFRNPALGGGEEVRVCNPCVPDPNYNPPPQYTPGPFPNQRYPSYYPTSGGPTYHPLLSNNAPRTHRSSQSVDNASQPLGRDQTSRRDPFSDRSVSYHNSTRVADLWPPPQQPLQNTGYPPYGQAALHPSYGQFPNPYNTQSLLNRPLPNPHATNQSGPPGSESSYYTGPRMGGRHHRPPPEPAPTPRRQIAEEDECPVCGNELPPLAANGSDNDRVQHVSDCITTYSASPPLPSETQNLSSTSLPSQRTRGMSNAGAATGTGNGEGTSTVNVQTLANPNPNHRMSLSARGMIVYTATEKDALDEDGTRAECVICFEEFEAGSRLGRLVCWCKFHEACIKQWWEKKGRGACPTHQLH